MKMTETEDRNIILETRSYNRLTFFFGWMRCVRSRTSAPAPYGRCLGPVGIRRGTSGTQGGRRILPSAPGPGYGVFWKPCPRWRSGWASDPRNCTPRYPCYYRKPRVWLRHGPVTIENTLYTGEQTLVGFGNFVSPWSIFLWVTFRKIKRKNVMTSGKNLRLKLNRKTWIFSVSHQYFFPLSDYLPILSHVPIICTYLAIFKTASFYILNNVCSPVTWALSSFPFKPFTNTIEN